MDIASKKVFKSLGLWIWYVILPICSSWLIFGDLLFNAFWAYPSFIFVIISAICVAVMDSVENEHFFNTKFRDLNENFWYKRISWDKAKKIFGWKFDAWHIFKSLSLISGGFALYFYIPVNTWYWDILAIGYYYNTTFNGFYNHIFKR